MLRSGIRGREPVSLARIGDVLNGHNSFSGFGERFCQSAQHVFPATQPVFAAAQCAFNSAQRVSRGSQAVTQPSQCVFRPSQRVI